MTSFEIRKSFLDFFKSKQHTIVPSSSLLPDSPNLLFTNAGMNQFVPIFLGQEKCPYQPGRAADTQKCIRAGGKHNDLEDVGLDTYHHTFFEMLGNWSFGDYFKKEAIDWAWELVTEIWKFPKNRVYATVYSPDKSKNDPSEFDQEAWGFWAQKFSAAGLDPSIHIVHGNKKDNFWMMGETGPCGPCSELHIDLTPDGGTKGSLVNKGSPLCIEIWNLVFIQFNANQDGTFSPLPARHVDTGMGFERVTGIIQNTQNFTDFSSAISNYETDIFAPIFKRLEELSGRKYRSTLPKPGSTGDTEQEKIDVAFRVIADHIRTLSFSIADGILPGNNDRNYVLRRILRRAVRYGRNLGFEKPFFFSLVGVLATTMGEIFPEIRQKQKQVEDVIRAEEEAFNKTLDRGLELFKEETNQKKAGETLSGSFVFKLYDTYGFPLDLTDLMAREMGLSVDHAGFEKEMQQQREKARAAQKREIISVTNIDTTVPTRFFGYDQLSGSSKIVEIVQLKDKIAVVSEASPFYAEMGGQVGDRGIIDVQGRSFEVVGTQKMGNTFLHLLAGTEAPEKGMEVRLAVDFDRRKSIERHHTVTHLLHWALHEVVGPEATQKGSFVGSEKLTFDFNCPPLSAAQISQVERLVNEKIRESASVSWSEIPYHEIKGRKDVLQFFGEKYGDQVRVVQIGGKPGSLDGFSMELCGGTHTRSTGEIGLFRIMSESAVSSGVRRIEALAGTESYARMKQESELLGRIAITFGTPVADLEKKLEGLQQQQKEMERQIKNFQLKQAEEQAVAMLSRIRNIGSVQAVVERVDDLDGNQLQALADQIKTKFEGVVILGSISQGAVSLVATVPSSLTGKVQAGKIIQNIAPIVGGKGGGKPDNARGGGKDGAKLEECLSRAMELLASV